MTCAGLWSIAAKVTNTASAEMDNIAPIKWLMELKYSLLSGEDINGSRDGFCRFMYESISYLLRLKTNSHMRF
jgi:hypothetical protein